MRREEVKSQNGGQSCSTRCWTLRRPSVWQSTSRTTPRHHTETSALLGFVFILLVLVGFQLRVQSPSLSLQLLQLLPEPGQAGFEDALQALRATIPLQLLQQGPLGLQDFVLLLQEAHL